MEKITSMDDYTFQYNNSLTENDAYWASIANGQRQVIPIVPETTPSSSSSGPAQSR